MADILIQNIRVEALSSQEIIREGTRIRLYFLFKRIIDVTVSCIGLALSSPLLLFIALLIKLESKGPVIFTQVRVGAKKKWVDGKLYFENCPFMVYKFRTMYCDAKSDCHKQYIEAFINNDQKQLDELQNDDHNGKTTYKLAGDPRITKIGKVLRKCSLDELPQLWNVIKDDMSLVGPRPPIPYEVEMYETWHYKRLQGIPGITGLWQVTARSTAEFDEMVALDIEYLENQSLWMDLKILLKTPYVVLLCRGAH